MSRKAAQPPTLYGPSELMPETAAWVCVRCGTVLPSDVFPCPVCRGRLWEPAGPLYSSAFGLFYGPTRKEIERGEA
jgi:hypothetical protein